MLLTFASLARFKWGRQDLYETIDIEGRMCSAVGKMKIAQKDHHSGVCYGSWKLIRARESNRSIDLLLLLEKATPWPCLSAL